MLINDVSFKFSNLNLLMDDSLFLSLVFKLSQLDIYFKNQFLNLNSQLFKNDILIKARTFNKIMLSKKYFK